MKEAVLRSKRMIFLSNFFPVIFNVKIVRKLFPRAKFVHVIHDFPWLTVFGGNEKAYMNFIEHIDWEEQTGNDDKFVKYCTYDILESFGLSDVIICLCRSTYYMLKDFYGIDVRKIRLIQNGMEDYATFPQYSERLKIMRKYNIPESGLNALLVGRLTFSKGADRIANMLKLINQNESLNLVYAGDDNVLEWLSKDVSCNVIQVGFVSHEDLCALYSVIISFKA